MISAIGIDIATYGLISSAPLVGLGLIVMATSIISIGEVKSLPWIDLRWLLKKSSKAYLLVPI